MTSQLRCVYSYAVLQPLPFYNNIILGNTRKPFLAAQKIGDRLLRLRKKLMQSRSSCFSKTENRKIQFFLFSFLFRLFGDFTSRRKKEGFEGKRKRRRGWLPTPSVLSIPPSLPRAKINLLSSYELQFKGDKLNARRDASGHCCRIQLTLE